MHGFGDTHGIEQRAGTLRRCIALISMVKKHGGKKISLGKSREILLRSGQNPAGGISLSCNKQPWGFFKEKTTDNS